MQRVNLPPVCQIAPHEKKVNCWVEDGHNHECIHKIHVIKIKTKWKYSLWSVSTDSYFWISKIKQKKIHSISCSCLHSMDSDNSNQGE